MQKFYEFAAQSDVEFGKLDLKTANGDPLAIVATSNDEKVVSILPSLVALFSAGGFTGVKQSHSHPINMPIPSGYYSYAKGNPLSLMPIPGKQSGDAENARLVRKYPGFQNMQFEVLNVKGRTKTIYDGVNQAKINTY
jgi:hypothetical protein